MPPAATQFNLTVDDFDSLITYPVQSQWFTPDPSAAPDPALDIWFDGTYHRTNTTGASFSFAFTGAEFFLYGAAGPAFGSYEVEHEDLAHADHTVKITNLGPKKRGEGTDLLVDFLKTTVDIAPGRKIFNPLFSGGFSRYTNDNATVSLSFHATALFIFGDKTDRHGLYTVALDGGAPARLTASRAAAACSRTPAKRTTRSNLDAIVLTTSSSYFGSPPRVHARRTSGALRDAEVPGLHVHFLLVLFLFGLWMVRPARR
ncbi:hypothetical protein B0H17DRAFT_1152818 [Mycena rosella]|uniref:Uncharacterized protein n=1 Tax=Mycena rosella TaxID=1033263 RepID=A0AAD7BAV6_MYCRO|nr:hypothetical protein B0H17DRAFT_1152818 [Mycena rosella]